MSLPIGSNRKKDYHHRENSPKREHVYVENPAAMRADLPTSGAGQKHLDENAIEKMKMLKEKYGDVSALAKFSKKPALRKGSD